MCICVYVLEYVNNKLALKMSQVKLTARRKTHDKK